MSSESDELARYLGGKMTVETTTRAARPAPGPVRCEPLDVNHDPDGFIRRGQEIAARKRAAHEKRFHDFWQGGEE